MGRRSSTRTRPYKGKITAYDSPIYIADAALYLMKTKPDLKITNPYALDDNQFQAAVDLLKAQHPIIGEYWADCADEIASLRVRRDRDRHDLAVQRQHHQRRQEGHGRGDRAHRGRDRLVGHLDDRRQGHAPELHVQVDGLDRLARRSTPRWRSGSARRRRRPEGVRRDGGQELLRDRTTPTDADYAKQDLVLDDADQGVPRRPRTPRASTTTCWTTAWPGSRADRL